MIKTKLAIVAALAVISSASFAQGVVMGGTEMSYSKTDVTGSSLKQEYVDVAQGVKVGAVPLVVELQGGRSAGENVYGLAVGSGTEFKLANNGWTLDLEGKLSTGAVRTAGSALWLAGSNFDLTKSTTMIDVSATSAYPLARERSVNLDLITAVAAGQGLSTFTTNYHPTVFKNGLALTSKTSLGQLKLTGAYSQFGGNNVAVDYAKEFSVEFTRRNWGVDVSYVSADNGVNNTSVGVSYKF